MIDVVDHGTIRELRLARPPVNALDPSLIAALRAALAEAVAAGHEAIVLSGAPGRFSGGLDVPALLQLDRAGIHSLWTDFFGLMRDLASLPVPIATAITGHSPAGGAVLAIFTDYRVFAEGPFMVGLNEVQVGLTLPPMVLRALTFVVGERQAARLATGGYLLSPPEALRCGFVDEVVPPAEVVPRAIAWCTEILSRPRGAMTATRALARRPLVAAFDEMGAQALATMVDNWFAPEPQATLRALVARLKKPTA
jgi:enoyl-CoA hydratase/carnithine racemase